MKILATVLALTLLAVSQTAAPSTPITVQATSSMATATNTSAKEIVMIAVTVTVNEQADSFPVIHDRYFHQGGLAAGDEMDIVHPMQEFTLVSVAPLFVQFADGSTWGTLPDDRMKSVTDNRAATVALYKGAMAAYAQSADQGLVDYLTNYTGDAQGFAKHWLSVQQTSGTAAAVSQIQQRLATAQARTF